MYKKRITAIALGASLFSLPLPKYSLVSEVFNGPVYNVSKKESKQRKIDVVGYEWDATPLMDTFNKVKRYNKYNLNEHNQKSKLQLTLIKPRKNSIGCLELSLNFN